MPRNSSWPAVVAASKGRTYDRTVLRSSKLVKTSCQSGRSTYESEPVFSGNQHAPVSGAALRAQPRGIFWALGSRQRLGTTTDAGTGGRLRSELRPRADSEPARAVFCMVAVRKYAPAVEGYRGRPPGDAPIGRLATTRSYRLRITNALVTLSIRASSLSRTSANGPRKSP